MEISAKITSQGRSCALSHDGHGGEVVRTSPGGRRVFEPAPREVGLAMHELAYEAVCMQAFEAAANEAEPAYELKVEDCWRRPRLAATTIAAPLAEAAECLALARSMLAFVASGQRVGMLPADMWGIGETAKRLLAQAAVGEVGAVAAEAAYVLAGLDRSTPAATYYWCVLAASLGHERALQEVQADETMRRALEALRTR